MKANIYVIFAGWLLFAVSVVSAQETPYFEYIWNEGDGPVTISAIDLETFGQTVARIEIDWTPSTLSTTGPSQQLLNIPNHLGLWVWNDGIHGEWFDDVGTRRLFRTRWGLPTVGVETKIAITWNANGYAVIVDGVVRIHDWQTLPTTVHPDPDAVSGVYGANADGTNPVSGTFKLRTYDKALAYDACSVDVVGTINEGVPLDNTGEWSQGIDPLCAPVSPNEVTLAWVNATQNEDGTAIPATGDTSLATTTIQYTICLDGKLDGTRAERTYPADVLTADISIITPGDWCFVAFHTNVAGTSSGESNVAMKTVAPVVPNPPSMLTVTDLIVYTIIKQKDKFVLLSIGTVAAGTSCDPDESVNGHYVVPNDAVQWTAATGPRPIVVVAKCS